MNFLPPPTPSIHRHKHTFLWHSSKLSGIEKQKQTYLLSGLMYSSHCLGFHIVVHISHAGIPFRRWETFMKYTHEWQSSGNKPACEVRQRGVWGRRVKSHFSHVSPAGFTHWQLILMASPLTRSKLWACSQVYLPQSQVSLDNGPKYLVS